MSGAGAAETVEDDALSPSLLAGLVSSLFEDKPRLSAMSAASTTLARPDAARTIADEVLAAASGAPYAPTGSKRRTDG
jgi:UDP-N-acetylglucosamine--N-acetylmuramyl-(pentapeptide) pyrophosphoryl-undecaprenol N-acetylglucosamine transferase